MMELNVLCSLDGMSKILFIVWNQFDVGVALIFNITVLQECFGLFYVKFHNEIRVAYLFLQKRKRKQKNTTTNNSNMDEATSVRTLAKMLFCALLLWCLRNDIPLSGRLSNESIAMLYVNFNSKSPLKCVHMCIAFRMERSNIFIITSNSKNKTK